ncbi:MAG: SGNH/GDSL hydrolase family protein [Janthinobacterium lividum]
MPNIINALGTRANTSQPLEFQNPTTLAWVQGTATSTAGGNEFAAQLTGVAPGDYAAGTLKMRIVGLPTVYYNTTAVKVLGTTTPAPTGSFTGKLFVDAWGDSRTQGAELADPATTSWPSKFQAIVGDNYFTRNSGYGGYASYDLLGVFEQGAMQPFVAARAAGSVQAGVSIMYFGVNDWIKRIDRGETVAQTAENLHNNYQQMVQRALQEYSVVIVTYETPAEWNIQPYYEEWRDWLAAHYQSWGNGSNVLMADMRVLNSSSQDPTMYRSGVHPTELLTGPIAQIYADMMPQVRQLIGASNSTTTAAPTVTFTPATRKLTASHTLYATSQLEMRRNLGTWGAYAEVQVDNASHLADEWQYRVAAATGRNAGYIAGNNAISAASTATPTPTPTPASEYAGFTTAYLVNQDVTADADGNVTRIGNLTGVANDATLLAGTSAKLRTDGPGNLPYVRLTATQLITTLPALVGNRAAYVICRVPGGEVCNLFGQKILRKSDGQPIAADMMNFQGGLTFHDLTTVGGTIKDVDVPLTEWHVRCMVIDEGHPLVGDEHPYQVRMRSLTYSVGAVYSGGAAEGGNIIGGGAGATWANGGTVDIAGWFTTTNITDADYTKTLALIRNKTGVQ